MNSDIILRYTEPASEWTDALPLGNGRLGCMVFGSCGKERIQFNEDTLWSGRPEKKETADGRADTLQKVRGLVFREKYTEAQAEADARMLGPWSSFYEPMGDLYLDFGAAHSAYSGYSRSLNLNNAVAEVSYRTGGAVFTRRIFVSHPDDAVIIRLDCSKKGMICVTASMDSLLAHEITDDFFGGFHSLVMNGRAPVSGPNEFGPGEDAVVYDEAEGMRFTARLSVRAHGGIVSCSKGTIAVADADSVEFVLTAATSFNGFRNEAGTDGRDCRRLCAETEKKVLSRSYEDIEKKHIHDYSFLYNRVSFSLDAGSLGDSPVPELLEAVKAGASTALLAPLYFQYGRYLLISCSRPGSQAANLQGIWNQDLRPAWNCNYTTNINLEMNYWPADVCNLSECENPLFDLIKDLAVTGADTAKTRYGCRGWTAHHNCDLWRKTSPAGGSSEWALWPLGGAWLCTHIWEHYSFTGDKSFLADMYPVLKGAVEFLLDWLVAGPDGTLVTCPSISPENNFIDPETGKKCSVSMASTMDMTIIRELFGQCRQAAAVLNTDADLCRRLSEAEGKLYPYRTGKNGQLQEWYKDFEQYEPGHRHVSHLWGLYPGHQISENRNAELLNACRTSLELRLKNGGGHTGWSCSWIACLYARLKDSGSADNSLGVLFKKLTYGNLLNVCPPFQIDGNFGGTAAIAEMLLQSTPSYIELLPALPDSWHSGHIAGLRTRQRCTVSMDWKNNVLSRAVVTASADGMCAVKYEKPLVLVSRNADFSYNGSMLVFYAERDKEYTIAVR